MASRQPVRPSPGWCRSAALIEPRVAGSRPTWCGPGTGEGSRGVVTSPRVTTDPEPDSIPTGAVTSPEKWQWSEILVAVLVDFQQIDSPTLASARVDVSVGSRITQDLNGPPAIVPGAFGPTWLGRESRGQRRPRSTSSRWGHLPASRWTTRSRCSVACRDGSRVFRTSRLRESGFRSTGHSSCSGGRTWPRRCRSVAALGEGVTAAMSRRPLPRRAKPDAFTWGRGDITMHTHLLGMTLARRDCCPILPLGPSSKRLVDLPVASFGTDDHNERLKEAPRIRAAQGSEPLPAGRR